MKKLRYLYKLCFHFKESFGYRMGIHSGFPLCCVTFWCLVWSQMGVIDGWTLDGKPVWIASKQRWLLDHIWRPLERGKDRQYVSCPWCLVRGHFVETHDCERDNPECDIRGWSIHRERARLKFKKIGIFSE
jgi:hypothetical protein